MLREVVPQRLAESQDVTVGLLDESGGVNAAEAVGFGQPPAAVAGLHVDL